MPEEITFLIKFHVSAITILLAYHYCNLCIRTIKKIVEAKSGCCNMKMVVVTYTYKVTITNNTKLISTLQRHHRHFPRKENAVKSKSASFLQQPNIALY